jgi:hypothetical protein
MTFLYTASYIKVSVDWKCGSSGKAPVLQAQSPEFKPQSHKKKKKKKVYVDGAQRETALYVQTNKEVCPQQLAHEWGQWSSYTNQHDPRPQGNGDDYSNRYASGRGVKPPPT